MELTALDEEDRLNDFQKRSLRWPRWRKRKHDRSGKPLPAPNSDVYEFAESLPVDELAVVKKVRADMETKVQPIINKYWVEDSFPFELLSPKPARRRR
jgi:hypothetical protein